LLDAISSQALLSLFHPSNTVTAPRLPEAVDGGLGGMWRLQEAGALKVPLTNLVPDTISAFIQRRRRLRENRISSLPAA
jgi:hypothetical protein